MWLLGFVMWCILVSVVFLCVMLCSLNVIVIMLKQLFGKGIFLVLYSSDGVMMFLLSSWLWFMCSIDLLMLVCQILFVGLVVFVNDFVRLLVLVVMLSILKLGCMFVCVIVNVFYVWCMFVDIRLFIRLQLFVIE